jgi:hypothetical protein
MRRSLLQQIASKPAIIPLLGQPGSGKTNAIKYLVWQDYENSEEPPYVFVFSKVLFNKDYDFNPEKHTFKEVTQPIVTQILTNKQLIGKRKIFIIDDGGKPMGRWWMDFLGAYRHHNCSIFVTGRIGSQINKDARETSTYACIFKITTRSQLKEAWEMFGQEMDKEKFYKMCSTLKKHHFILYERGAEKPYSIQKAGLVPSNFKFSIKPTKAP